MRERVEAADLDVLRVGGEERLERLLVGERAGRVVGADR
jgi:hypothetical protein